MNLLIIKASAMIGTQTFILNNMMLDVTSVKFHLEMERNFLNFPVHMSSIQNAFYLNHLELIIIAQDVVL